MSIFLSYKSKKREVVALLDELHKLLESDNFDINTDLILICKKKQGENQKFSTPYTLLDLDYDAEDVVNRLKELKIEEYSETKIDTDNVNPPDIICVWKGHKWQTDLCEIKDQRSAEASGMCVISLCKG